jgi:hypothetical protein
VDSKHFGRASGAGKFSLPNHYRTGSKMLEGEENLEQKLIRRVKDRLVIKRSLMETHRVPTNDKMTNDE